MLYYSTNLQAQPVTFREALLKGLAPDRIFMLPQLPIISGRAAPFCKFGLC